MAEPISVVIPVGPYEANKRWLPQAVESALLQSLKPVEILLIDDQASLTPGDLGLELHREVVNNEGFIAWRDESLPIKAWRTPWLSGVAHAFNFGVALAKSELVFMLGSDDYLDLRCLERCVRAWETNQKEDAYYWVGVHYLDEREEKDQFLPCGAAMVTKGFWKWSGGFPTQSASGASDAALISCLWGNYPKKLVPVHLSTPLYSYRSHEGSDSSRASPWQGVILATRDILTSNFKPRS